VCEELNQMVLRSAMGAGFTGIEICAADTTVQESPIAYPTEVGHMKNIAEKILGFGKKLGLKSLAGLSRLKDKRRGYSHRFGYLPEGRPRGINQEEEVVKKDAYSGAEDGSHGHNRASVQVREIGGSGQRRVGVVQAHVGANQNLVKNGVPCCERAQVTLVSITLLHSSNGL